MELPPRMLLVSALVPWLALSAVIAPEHLHESDAADHVAIVHRHLAPHDHDHTAVAHADHDLPEFSDADAHVVWLGQVGIAEATRSFPQLLVVVSTHVTMTPPRVRHAVVTADTATLAHGPPRVSLSLRAPPLASRLI